jgi:hypothetical protein
MKEKIHTTKGNGLSDSASASVRNSRRASPIGEPVDNREVINLQIRKSAYECHGGHDENISTNDLRSIHGGQ